MNDSSDLLVNLSVLMKQPTGISTYALNIIPHLQSLSPTLLVAEPVKGFQNHLISARLTPEYGVYGHLRRLTWLQWQLRKIYQDYRSQLLYSPLPEAPLFSSCRCVVTVHDLIPLRFAPNFSAVKVYFRHYVPAVLQQAEHILCDSEATAVDIVNFFNVPAAKLTTVPLACDRQHFRFLDLPTANYFLYVGRHDTYKNLSRLIEAFAAVAQTCEVDLWVAGSHDPNCTPLYIEQIAVLGLEHRVKFLDYLPYAELPRVINQAIALVFPSLWEGFGLPVLEAMACGTPVITSNVSSLPEVAGDAAILVDPYRVEAIASAMQQVATDGQARSQLRQAGLARASQFSWEKTGAATAAVLQRYL